MATVLNQTSAGSNAVRRVGEGQWIIEARREVHLVPDGAFRLRPYFSKPGVHPFEQVTWERRTAAIANSQGEEIFRQEEVEVPCNWSQMAANVVASKYFNGKLGTPERESSVRQIIERVAGTIARWGRGGGYFLDDEEGEVFYHELAHVLLHQMASFNSPVWFNCGVQAHPQCSACFINSVNDTMESILRLAQTEGMLFKWGSGTGTNFSPLRSSREHLSRGGTASGPVSFMKGYDAFAGVIKSGGTTRRAAKMVILNADHPDIVEFIACKANEEKKAWALIDAGYDGSLDGAAYSSVFFQNSNNSVRVPDAFIHAVLEDREWKTRSILTGETMSTHRARDLMRMIAEAAHLCGDPGMQFDTTINNWNACPASGRINASNPCSEYMFLDDTACNLSSLNLMKFRREDGSFDVDSFCHAVSVLILAQEIIVGYASYPTQSIAQNSHRFRPLGLGYANLGALLLASGLPYDSEAGRAAAAAITALMTGQAYLMSARTAGRMGAFEGFEENRDPFLRVIRNHLSAVDHIDARLLSEALVGAAKGVWDEALALGERFGYRNAQTTVLAPTGTIAFMMDCDTTGIEPDIALVKYKRLVGGGMLKIVNQTVPAALKRLGYSSDAIATILAYIDDRDTIEGAPGLQEEHLPVFDCAFKPINGGRSIHYLGHIRMMGAVQPFLSGAISKTVNMPKETTVQEVSDTYLEAWRLGVKSIAIYRDGCKRTQPLSTSRTEGESQRDKEYVKHDVSRVGASHGDGAVIDEEFRRNRATPIADRAELSTPTTLPARPKRRRLPPERNAITHKFSIGGHEGYITVGMYEDGAPGEIFIVMAKEGSVISGLMDSFATSISIALQYGVPLEVLVNKFARTRFEPYGYTSNPDIPVASSVVDYIFRWLARKFLKKSDDLDVDEQSRSRMEDALEMVGDLKKQFARQVLPTSIERSSAPMADDNGQPRSFLSQGADLEVAERLVFRTQADAPPCPECGSTMVRNGSCFKCTNCGATSGCS